MDSASMDAVSLRRGRDHLMVNVSRKVGPHRLHWQVRVVGPTKDSIVAAIREAQKRLDVQAQAIEEVFA